MNEIIDTAAIAKDARSLIYISDGSSGSDKVARLLGAVTPLLGEVARLRKVIDEAPHSFCLGGGRDEGCSCWKRKATPQNLTSAEEGHHD